MYAVVSSGGKQYRVEPGTTLTMERLGVQAGEALTFDRVLLVGDGEQVTVGTPVVDGASVSATVLGEELGPKLVIFKFKQKVKYRRRTGHRQHLVRVRIDAINAEGGKKKAAVKPAKAAEEPSTAEAKQAEATPVERKPAEAKPARKPRTSRAKSTAKASASEASASEEKSEKKPARKPRARKASPKAEEQQ